MKKRIDITTWAYIATIVIIYFLGTTMGLTQETITASNFNSKIAKDVVAVEFWAEWNQANQFNELAKLKDTSVYRVDITHCSGLQAEYNIIAIPTVVLFDNGVEKERFNANIMFQLEADKKVIQNSIDTIILNKFQ
jgi:thiol-disulfide isomerase/thioredoxin|tara:strand:- start:2067 stop:2474 length:408 start_codon:yes stop_codon:yes gene_type:complete